MQIINFICGCGLPFGASDTVIYPSALSSNLKTVLKGLVALASGGCDACAAGGLVFSSKEAANSSFLSFCANLFFLSILLNASMSLCLIIRCPVLSGTELDLGSSTERRGAATLSSSGVVLGFKNPAIVEDRARGFSLGFSV